MFCTRTVGCNVEAGLVSPVDRCVGTQVGGSIAQERRVLDRVLGDGHYFRTAHGVLGILVLHYQAAQVIELLVTLSYLSLAPYYQ